MIDELAVPNCGMEMTHFSLFLFATYRGRLKECVFFFFKYVKYVIKSLLHTLKCAKGTEWETVVCCSG